ncbi:MAG TPA: hypothetical protein VJ962_12960 [Clostridia bacterium]|nr:hypothetical protein [Clostridia bacterium]
MLYLIFIFLSLIIIYFRLSFTEKSSQNIIIGIVQEINCNFLLIKSSNNVYFVQITRETYFDGTSLKEIKPNQSICIEHTDLIMTSSNFQTFGKRIKIANQNAFL